MQQRYSIQRAVVIGAGTMGAAIAAHLANAGVQVHLLDIVSSKLSAEEEAHNLSLQDREVRNSIVNRGWEQLLKSRPPALMSPVCAELVHLGNLEDDLQLVRQADWVIEAIIEDLSVKRALMEQLDALRGERTIISTNTSGIPISKLLEGRSLTFRQHFLGTHFFNPPRYLKLLELIPNKDTLSQVTNSMAWFCEVHLGKGVVLCKDTPNFIGNRLFCGSTAFTLDYALEHGYTVDEVDNISGPFMGRPKTATFRLLDLIGIDVMQIILRNLSSAIHHDKAILPYITSNRLMRLLDEMTKRNWFGNKTKVGFYKTVITKEGKKEFWTLNLKTLEHEPPICISRSDSMARANQENQLTPRLHRILSERDRLSKLAQMIIFQHLSYASFLIPEIADNPQPIDDAIRWGFAYEVGPFEMWEQLGLINMVDKMQPTPFSAAAWVEAMLQKGRVNFYRDDGKGQREVYCPEKNSYMQVARSSIRPNKARLEKNIFHNESATLTRMEGDAFCLLLHSKMNIFNEEVLTILEQSLDHVRREGVGLLISTQSEHFSAGADLSLILSIAQAGKWERLKQMLLRFQTINQQLRNYPKPVVAMPSGWCLGGGMELLMHCSRVVTDAELKAGLVEVGVGLIPAGGGIKEMVRRFVTPPMRTPSALVLPYLQRVLQQIGMAKVSVSAIEARQMGILSAIDRIVMHREHLLMEGLREIQYLAEAEDVYPLPQKLYAAGRDALATLRVAIFTQKESGQITAYDAVIAEKLAYVLCGGELSSPTWVEETFFLDLEREAFLSLCGEKNTQERMAYMLKNGTPLRN